MFLSCPISPSCIDSSILFPLAKSARGLNWCLDVLTALGQTCSLMLCVPLFRGCCVQYFWACSRCVGEFQTCVNIFGCVQHFWVCPTFLAVFNIFGRVQQKLARSTLFGCVQHFGPALRRTSPPQDPALRATPKFRSFVPSPAENFVLS